MSRGSGIIQRTNKVEAAVIPPATVTGARSGTSLSGTFVELGGLATPLLHNTTIPLDIFDLIIQDAAIQYLFFDQSAQRAILGDISGPASVVTDPGTSRVLLGSITGSGNGSFLSSDDANQELFFQSNLNKYLLLDVGSDLYRIGDIDNAGNRSKIDIKDASQAIELDAGLSPSRLTLVGTAGNESLVFDAAGSPYLSLNLNTQAFRLGDIGSVGNGIVLDLEDTVQQGSISSSGFTMLFLDMPNGIFQLGASAGGTFNFTYLEINDVLQTVNVNSGGSVTGISLDMGNFIYTIGDIGNFNNGDTIMINDTLGQITINGSNIVRIDTTVAGINMSPNVSPFGVLALPAFANNAAAVVGGLSVGEFYRISAAGTSAVAVVQ